MSLLVTACVAQATSTPIQRTQLPDALPLLGKWVMVFPPLACHEQRDFKTNGTSESVSGQEQLESEWSLREVRPGKVTYYEWTDRVLKTNGKQDCTGRITPIGDAVTRYLYINPITHLLEMCERPDPTTCFAFFER